MVLSSDSNNLEDNTMTRINLLKPSQLTSKHLMAEYRELPRIFTLVKQAISKGKSISDFDIAERYLLGKGHVTFFYDKLRWLWNRYSEIHRELMARGFNLDSSLYFSILQDAHQEFNYTSWWGQYKPSPEDIYLNMARVAKRSNVESVLAELSD